MMSLFQVCNAVQGELIGSDSIVSNIAINTRADCEGRLFVALKGDNFDAHDFVEQAAEAGALALMVEREVSSSLPMIRVKDTHKALKDLAAWWRLQFPIPVLAVTGSVGKTTVKEMLGAITAEIGQGVVTHGNLNNEIGVPLTLMRLTPEDQYAVVEMGMNQAGEIERLSAIARPTVAIVNNAAAAHLEGLGTIEAVANAKGEIFSGMANDGVAVINADDPFADLWSDLVVDKKTITFGLKKKADVTATYKKVAGQLILKVSAKGKKAKIRLNSVGEHNVSNALAAIATALAAKVPLEVIVKGFENYQPVKGRLNPIVLAGFVLFDDTYNANPASMHAAIRVLSEYDGNVLIVGDMAELGDSAQKEHVSLGEFAHAHGVDTLLACGDYADSVISQYHGKGMAFAEQSELLEYLQREKICASAVLVKGSRSAKMENVVEALKVSYGDLQEKSKGGEIIAQGQG